MGDCNEETGLFRPVSDDVVLMHGQVWRVREKGLVQIVEIGDPSGAPLGSSNWRSAYVGAYGKATFADDAMGSDLSVAQVRCLVYAQEDGGFRATRDMLRTSSGILTAADGGLVLVTKRTRYVFRRVEGEEAQAVERAIESL